MYIKRDGNRIIMKGGDSMNMCIVMYISVYVYTLCFIKEIYVGIYKIQLYKDQF